ncbi:hypothetical protein FSP39_025342 [Pinctada imbricata]|uniref:M-phase inducer phosphatase n=1 Tax=Pinctada imbricata TaxID=66713 RepID=A0AA89BVW9_PINIB|nr:hypothetical protein FSP39_025342 [Pinctada imbricata]
MTPSSKGAPPSVQVVDEDSGLGMEFDQCSPLTNHGEEYVVMSLNRLVEERNLIGDGSCSYSLPTIPGKHSDLTSITCHTAADLLNGKYNGVVGSYTLIDCRYPYEYEGGHIKAAMNIHWRQEQQVAKLLHSRDNVVDDKIRHIIIFYCEFSSERGPKMCRTFRQKDRSLNKDNYPHLNFPELYLLHDGYKAFYETYPELCEPRDYKPMLHKDHAADLRHFRSKSKSWSNGDKSRKRAQKLF